MAEPKPPAMRKVNGLIHVHTDPAGNPELRKLFDAALERIKDNMNKPRKVTISDREICWSMYEGCQCQDESGRSHVIHWCDHPHADGTGREEWTDEMANGWMAEVIGGEGSSRD